MFEDVAPEAPETPEILEKPKKPKKIEKPWYALASKGRLEDVYTITKEIGR